MGFTKNGINVQLLIRDREFTVKTTALAGNRTRVTRVAGENSTTEPTLLECSQESGVSELATAEA